MLHCYCVFLEKVCVPQWLVQRLCFQKISWHAMSQCLHTVMKGCVFGFEVTACPWCLYYNCIRCFSDYIDTYTCIYSVCLYVSNSDMLLPLPSLPNLFTPPSLPPCRRYINRQYRQRDIHNNGQNIANTTLSLHPRHICANPRFPLCLLPLANLTTWSYSVQMTSKYYTTHLCACVCTYMCMCMFAYERVRV